jgi:putative membrane protein
MFALGATQGNDAELDMARLALRLGTANEVKGYAGKMIAEHEGLMREIQPVLSRILGSAGAPERLAAPDALALRHLESVAPVDFDQAYAMQQIRDHLAALPAFQTEADNGTDPQLKALARKWLPFIQAHLELAVDLTQHIGGASPFKSH